MKRSIITLALSLVATTALAQTPPPAPYAPPPPGYYPGYPPPPPYGYPPPPGYYGYPPPMPAYPPPPPAPPPRRVPPAAVRVARSCPGGSCNVDRPRFFSVGLRYSSLGIDQQINGKDVTLGGIGVQTRFRTRGHFGIEAALDVLHGDFKAPNLQQPAANGTFHVGDVTRDSVPFTLSAMLYLFPNQGDRIFNLFGVGGVGIVATEMGLTDENGQQVKQDFTEYEAHVGAGAELRFRWLAIDADVRALALSRDDSSNPGSYYAGVNGGPVPSTSSAWQAKIAASLWF